ncbi:5-oxoprolinase subunit PxpA [Anoxynatronum sibiricum]|uniref:5-oxoprolinase subunit A n=1 Tax=Anoxynatronum sibiricum TaxID=210623 RepID=A0ABU9VPL6_9CLOT
MIDLNADLGESFGIYTMGNDACMMPHITSANIACGFHAGDPLVMQQTVELALKYGVAVGAHPGYPDLQGFGRRQMRFSSEEIMAMILYQAGALKAFLQACGGKLQHLKPHGALYNEAAVDEPLAMAVAKATALLGTDVILVGPPNSALSRAADRCQTPYAREIFADRAYEDDGRLVERRKEGALIHDVGLCIQRMLSMINGQPIESINGHALHLSGETICLHGDHPQAIAFAAALKKAIQESQTPLVPLEKLLFKQQQPPVL